MKITLTQEDILRLIKNEFNNLPVLKDKLEPQGPFDYEMLNPKAAINIYYDKQSKEVVCTIDKRI